MSRGVISRGGLDLHVGVVIPSSATGRPLVVTSGWWIRLAGRVAFVGLPIVGSIARDERRAAVPDGPAPPLEGAAL